MSALNRKNLALENEITHSIDKFDTYLIKLVNSILHATTPNLSLCLTIKEDLEGGTVGCNPWQLA